MKIPVHKSELTNEDKVISTFLGDDSKKEFKVKVVHEKSVEEIDESLKRAAKSFEQLSHSRLKETSIEQPRVPSSTPSKKTKEEERRQLIEKRKQEQEQTAKENRRIIVLIIITILGAIMLFNAKCNHSKSHHHYDVDPSMEYRHS